MLIMLALDLQPGEAVAICVARRSTPVDPKTTVIETTAEELPPSRPVGRLPPRRSTETLAPVVQLRRSA